MLTDKIAVVTGAGRGIGRAIALELARQGAHVVVSDIDIKTARSVSIEVGKLGRKTLTLAADVSLEASVDDLMSHTLKRFKTIDILVNNAGIISTGPLLETTVETWDRTHAVNLRGTFLCAKAVFPTMMAQRSGRIVNIASVAGKRGGGFHGNTCYAASKGGVIALTKGLAREGSAFNINVNGVAPAMIETEMIGGMDEAVRASLLKSIPLGRTGTVENVAAAVAFLASDAASYITGEIMDVDGGLMMD